MMTSLQLQREEGRRIGIFFFYHKTLLDKTSNVGVHYSSSSEGLFVALAYHKYKALSLQFMSIYLFVTMKAPLYLGFGIPVCSWAACVLPEQKKWRT